MLHHITSPPGGHTLMPETHLSLFVRRLRDYMESRGLTNAAVARVAGVDRSAVGKWLSGENEPKATHRRKLAEEFGLRDDPAGAAGRTTYDADLYKAVGDAVAERLDNAGLSLPHAGFLRAVDVAYRACLGETDPWHAITEAADTVVDLLIHHRNSAS